MPASGGGACPPQADRLQLGLLLRSEGGGGTPGLLKGEADGPSLAEVGQPLADAVGVPLQRLRHLGRRPAPRQEPKGMPAFPLPWVGGTIHPVPHPTFVQIPLLEQCRYFIHR